MLLHENVVLPRTKKNAKIAAILSMVFPPFLTLSISLGRLACIWPSISDKYQQSSAGLKKKEQPYKGRRSMAGMGCYENLLTHEANLKL